MKRRCKRCYRVYENPILVEGVMSCPHCQASVTAGFKLEITPPPPPPPPMSDGSMPRQIILGDEPPAGGGL